jgi:tellurite resistance protein TerC
VTSVGTPALWIGFTLAVLLMLALDLGVFHRQAHTVKFKEALLWSIVWVALSLCFNAYVWHLFGSTKALEFLTGYLIEKALSVDNIFVMLVIFAFFGVKGEWQHRVLFWGILGALVLRAIFILAGAALLVRFHWIFYIFGAFLIYTAWKLLTHDGEEIHPDQNRLLKLFKKFVPTTSAYDGAHFTVVKDGRRFATPLMAVLIVVETTDVMFALDSIPAIFAITTDPFIVYTSNICAILGLRAMYFMLAGVMGKFRFLNVGLSLVLAFVGAKMLALDFVKVPIYLSLPVVALLLVGSIVASLIWPGKPEDLPAPPVHGPEGMPVEPGIADPPGSANPKPPAA